jgi:hypothetical protein
MLGALSEGMNDQIDFDAPERMVLKGRTVPGEGNLVHSRTQHPQSSFLRRYLKKLAGAIHVYHPRTILFVQKFCNMRYPTLVYIESALSGDGNFSTTRGFGIVNIMRRLDRSQGCYKV